MGFWLLRLGMLINFLDSSLRLWKFKLNKISTVGRSLEKAVREST
jgi:hypothetical protein